MIQLIFYIFFIIIFICILYLREKSLAWLPLLYIVLDASFTYFTTLSVVTYIRPAIFIVIMTFFIRKLSINRLNKPSYLFLAYTLLLVFISPQLFYSLKGYMQVFISMMAFPLGFIYFNCREKIKILNKSVIILLIFSLVVTAIGYIFNIGRNFDYSKNSEYESIGLLGSGGLYPASFAIGIIPFIIRYVNSKSWRIIIIIAAILMYIFVLLNLRRTAILMPVVGLLTYFLFTPNKFRIAAGVILSLLILLSLSPFYSEVLLTRFKIREEKGRFDPDFYKTEGRYLENIEIVNKVMSFNDPVKSLIGYKVYASGRGEKDRVRMYHTDSAVLLGGTGLLGFVLYIIIYIKFFNWGKLLKYASINARLLRSTYYSILFMSIFISMNGSITLVSIRTLIFLYLGVLLSFTINNLNPLLLKSND